MDRDRRDELTLRLRYQELIQKLEVWTTLYPDDEAEIQLLQRLIAKLAPRVRAAVNKRDPLEQLARQDSLTEDGRSPFEDDDSGPR